MVFRRTAFGTLDGTIWLRSSRMKYIEIKVELTWVLPISTRMRKMTAMNRKNDERIDTLRVKCVLLDTGSVAARVFGSFWELTDAIQCLLAELEQKRLKIWIWQAESILKVPLLLKLDPNILLIQEKEKFGNNVSPSNVGKERRWKFEDEIITQIWYVIGINVSAMNSCRAQLVRFWSDSTVTIVDLLQDIQESMVGPGSNAIQIYVMAQRGQQGIVACRP